MDGGRLEWLVRQLVRRFLVDRSALESSHGSSVVSANDSNGLAGTPRVTDPPHVSAAFEYAMRIVGSRITPSLVADENGVVEAIKRRLVIERRTADAMTFADLHRKLASATGRGQLENRWALLHLLRAISEDQRRGSTADTRGSAIPFSSTLSLAAIRGGLPLLTVRSNSVMGSSSSLENTPKERMISSSNSMASGIGIDKTKLINGSLSGCQAGSVDEVLPLTGLPRGHRVDNRRPMSKLSIPRRQDDHHDGHGGDGSPFPSPLINDHGDGSHHQQQLHQQLHQQHPRVVAFKKYVELRQSGYGVPESALVRDVLYTCQGIDGRWIKWSVHADGYVLDATVVFPPAVVTRVRKLCELGWLYRRARAHVTETLEKGAPIDAIGTVGQAFCAALQEELSDYYRLLAVLESQVHNSAPLDAPLEEDESRRDGKRPAMAAVNCHVSSGSDILINSANGIGGSATMSTSAAAVARGAYLSLRRLAVWLAEPIRRMRLMAVLIDTCKNLKGGALAAAIHVHAQHGDPFVRSFMGQLLRRVCSPLFDMVKRFVLEGELDDAFGEFFVIADRLVRDEGLWRECYRVHGTMLPPFIPATLARRILRTGKSINFLRRCCIDQGWEDAAAEAIAAAGTSVVGIGYGDTAALETLAEEAATRIDLRLIKIMFEKFRFREHCLAIKRYLLLGQGDFIQYLMDLVGSELSLPASKISSFKLAGLLESAIRASNAQYDDADVLDKLRVKMMAHVDGDKGWDVFSLEYLTSMPLSTIFTETVMKLYLRVFNFLWRLKRVEHALSATWQTMKPNAAVARGERNLGPGREGGSKSRRALSGVLRRCQTLRSEMDHFVTNLQYYIMFEVLECSWADFLSEMDAAKDLDELIKAHEKFLQSIVEKALLGEQSQELCKTLFSMFDLMLRFRGFAERLYERARDMQNREERASRDAQRRAAIGAFHASAADEAKAAADQELSESFMATMGADMDKIALEYTVLFDDFIAKLPLQQHAGLKFLSFRLDFSEFYTRRAIPQGEMAQLKLRR